MMVLPSVIVSKLTVNDVVVIFDWVRMEEITGGLPPVEISVRLFGNN